MTSNRVPDKPTGSTAAQESIVKFATTIGRNQPPSRSKVNRQLLMRSGIFRTGGKHQNPYGYRDGRFRSQPARRSPYGSCWRCMRRYHLSRRTGHSPSHPRFSADIRRHSDCPGSAIDGGFRTRALNPDYEDLSSDRAMAIPRCRYGSPHR